MDHYELCSQVVLQVQTSNSFELCDDDDLDDFDDEVDRYVH